MGYHIDNIPKGEIGKSSKILEEILELQDAEKQGCRIMALVELSDIIGAVELYLEENYPDMTLRDLKSMSNITQRAFKDGSRISSKPEPEPEKVSWSDSLDQMFRNVDDMLDHVEKMEMPAQLLSLAQTALNDLKSREGEDIKEWAANLAKSFVDAEDEQPIESCCCTYDCGCFTR